MEMTFKQYIDNPLGKRNSVFSQRDMYKQMYTAKYNKLMLREAGKIQYTTYTDSKRNAYIIHIKIPSETVKEFYYDAIVYFWSTDIAVQSANTLKDYNVKFFSNDPAFVFTYLRVFLKNDMFFEDMKPKSSKLALKKDPKVTNPYEIPGYSKILYFAYLFMEQKNLFLKTNFTLDSQKYSTKKLLSNVEHTDKKIDDRIELGNKIRKEEKAAAKREEKQQYQQSKADKRAKSSANVSYTKNTPTTKRTSIVKRTKTTAKK